MSDFTQLGIVGLRSIRTRDGRTVTIYTTSHPGLFPIVGRIGDCSSVWQWRPDGTAQGDVGERFDLILRSEAAR